MNPLTPAPPATPTPTPATATSAYPTRHAEPTGADVTSAFDLDCDCCTEKAADLAKGEA